MLDADLAEMYGVLTKNLNLAVRRNLRRFPPEFQLSPDEASALRLQIATSNIRRGGRRYAPYAFTEHGVAMLSSVLRSARAIDVNIAIIRTFVKVRRILASNSDLAFRVAQHDLEIATLFHHRSKAADPKLREEARIFAPQAPQISRAIGHRTRHDKLVGDAHRHWR